MSDLKTAIEKYGISQANEFKSDAAYDGYAYGFTDALDLLWPCVEQLDLLTIRINPATSAIRHGTVITGEALTKMCNAQIDAEDALKELKAKVGG